MCYYAYIATPKPLKGVTFTKNNPEGVRPPPLHFEEIADEEDEAQQYRSLFSDGKYMYYVGSNTGCSCGLNYNPENVMYEEEEEDKAIRQASPIALLDFIKAYTKKEGSLEMYVLWEDDRRMEPKGRVTFKVSELSLENYFIIKSRFFYTFQN